MAQELSKLISHARFTSGPYRNECHEKIEKSELDIKLENRKEKLDIILR